MEENQKKKKYFAVLFGIFTAIVILLYFRRVLKSQMPAVAISYNSTTSGTVSGSLAIKEHRLATLNSTMITGCHVMSLFSVLALHALCFFYKRSFFRILTFFKIPSNFIISILIVAFVLELFLLAFLTFDVFLLLTRFTETDESCEHIKPITYVKKVYATVNFKQYAGILFNTTVTAILTRMLTECFFRIVGTLWQSLLDIKNVR